MVNTGMVMCSVTGTTRAPMLLPTGSRPAPFAARAAMTTLLLLASLIGAFAAPRARAECLALPSGPAANLEALAAHDARKAITEAQAQIAELSRSPRINPHALAALYAVEAEGYSLLDLDADARAAALKGIALTPSVRDPVHLYLLTVFALNVFDDEGLRNASVSIEDARVSQKRGSVADTCLLVTLGTMQHFLGRDDQAIVNLVQAYSATAGQPMSEPRARAAAALSVVLKAMGDIDQALALNQDVIDWDEANHATQRLSESRYRRGDLLLSRKDYTGALAEFAEVRSISIALHDDQGVGFSDLRSCEVYLALDKLMDARTHCDSAVKIFQAANTIDLAKEAKTFLAEVDTKDGRASRALAGLNAVLDHDGSDVSQKTLSLAYHARAEANAALGSYRDAYVDLGRYLDRFTEINEIERTRNAAALRARFGADREAERNASLSRELALERERAGRQRDSLQWASITAVSAIIVAGLLAYLLAMLARTRRKFQELAITDGLTGLPNRRRTAEIAIQALSTAASNYRQLTIALLDLDHFKSINDRCGHATGDRVLVELGRIAREHLHPGDTFGRWGGEEFLMVMPDTPLDIALQRVETLRKAALGIALPPTALHLKVSLSAGLATSDECHTSLDEIIARADVALYEAKNQGRDIVKIADESYRMASSGVRRALRHR